MQISDLDYDLPPRSIAAAPAEPRDSSRLLVVQAGGTTSHRHFRDLPGFLRPGDLLVVNDTRVLPARLALRRRSGAAIDGLFLSEIQPGEWEVMLRTRGKVKVGETLVAQDFTFQLTARIEGGLWRVAIAPIAPAAAILDQIGHVPLPPYIARQRRSAGHPEEVPSDRQWYQTVFARDAASTGSVAAPTAGLHFTPDLLANLHRQGVALATVDLEVGLGTFLPVQTATLEEHPMHTERFHIPAATISALRDARHENRRIIAVGTTAVRTLEAAADQILAPIPQDSGLKTPDSPGISGQTKLLIAPPYRFRLTDVLITNFHLPRSTLMALVAAFLEPDGVARLQALYAEAIREGYRFYSYGDAMLILPETPAP
jgi:S-adenosylmethionine:tRNA ribosyltransferase-isomerase